MDSKKDECRREKIKHKACGRDKTQGIDPCVETLHFYLFLNCFDYGHKSAFVSITLRKGLCMERCQEK